MSYCRARRVTALRRGKVLLDPWAPDTDLHHCRIRRVEFVVDCRTDGSSGRDEKDVDVRSCSCGVAEKKSAARMAHVHRGCELTRLPEPYSVWNGALILGCAGARMVLSVAVIVQQHLNGRLILGESPAAFFIIGNCPLGLVGSIPQLGAPSFAAASSELFRWIPPIA